MSERDAFLDLSCGHTRSLVIKHMNFLMIYLPVNATWTVIIWKSVIRINDEKYCWLTNALLALLFLYIITKINKRR